MQSRADLIHGESVGGQMHESRVLRECEKRPSWIETDVGRPTAEVGRVCLRKVVVDCIEVEIPSIPSICLHQRILEDRSPLGAEDVVLQLCADSIESSFGVEGLQEVEIFPQLSKGLVVVLVHGSGVDPKIASDLIEVIAGSGKCNLTSDSVSSQSCHRDLMFVHESSDIVCINQSILATSSHPNSSVWSELPKFLG